MGTAPTDNVTLLHHNKRGDLKNRGEGKFNKRHRSGRRFESITMVTWQDLGRKNSSGPTSGGSNAGKTLFLKENVVKSNRYVEGKKNVNGDV